MPSPTGSDVGSAEFLAPLSAHWVPLPRLPISAPLRGHSAVAAYLRIHLYGAAVGRSLLDRCASAVGPEDRARLAPLRAQFDGEIEVAAHLLSGITPFGTPGRRLLRFSSGVTLAFLPVGPVMTDPLARLGVLEALRTLVVAKKSMWLLLTDWCDSGGAATVAEEGRFDDDDDDDGSGSGSGSGDDDNDNVLITRNLLAGLAEQAAAQEELLEELRRAYGLAVFR